MNSFCRYVLLWLFGLLLSEAGFAQSDTTYDDYVKFYDLYVGGGNPSVRPWFTTTAQFRKLAPKSQLMQLPIAFTESGTITASPSQTVTQDQYQPFDNYSIVYVQAGATFKLRDNEMRDLDGPWLKVGACVLGDGVAFGGGVFQTTSRWTDTVAIVGTQPVSRDSFTLRRLDYSYRHHSVNAEATFYFQVNRRGIVSAFGGAGLMLGLNFGGIARLRYQETKIVTDHILLANGVSTEYSTYRTDDISFESIQIKPGPGAALFLDMGLNLRLGQHSPLFRKLFLYGEYKPAFRADLVPKYGFFTSVINLWNVGVRYQFGE
jgi:hypothetical protein